MSEDIFVHSSADVEEGAEIGAGTKIWHFSHVMPDVTIGESCTLGQNVFVMDGVRIGNNVKIQNNVSLYDGVVCEDNVFIGPSAVFTNVSNPRSAVSRSDEFEKTLLRYGSTIGANATIVCGCEVGKHAFVGAGAVVTRDVSPHSIVVGVPARHVGWACECGERIEPDVPCRRCGRIYTLMERAGASELIAE